jgi:hypothetical protein
MTGSLPAQIFSNFESQPSGFRVLGVVGLQASDSAAVCKPLNTLSVQYQIRSDTRVYELPK